MKVDRPNLDYMAIGVKTYGNSVRKNATSTNNYHILSNLTNEQHDGQFAYDGTSKEADIKKSMNQAGGVELSERFQRKQ